MPEIFGSSALLWAIIGVALLVLELTSFTFILSFLGVGALVVAITTWLGLTPGLAGQLAVFSAASLLLTLLFRRTAKKFFSGHPDVPREYVGEKVPVVKPIHAGGEGAVAYRGSEWLAFSDDEVEIPAGVKVEILGMEGIRVKVKRIVP